ncbi:SDR family NAD(P)-dependent oxidoreductase [Pseudomaricurvus alkylphenolicus]|uniref:SDR family NAD(P)-dependent oxidoreductase n=1 Tax=Pseudomaricurvus alkylphenolicus TaxID=1306991 RepID=UPI00142351B6|nr:SDR family NAD(P)-dependent oxidoreductase [Pseudomaricurvus alkylphenolicus]
MDLVGKRIIVTGAFGGLGRQVVDMALAAGAAVAAVDYAPAPTGATELQLHSFGGVDLTSESAAAHAFEQAVSALGGLDGLINIAGGFTWETFAEGAVDSWVKMFDINLKTAVIASHAAMPYLLQQSAGSIVNIGANSAQKSEMGVAAYTASKAGVAKLTESLADEYKSRVRVNAVLPSIIDTEINRRDMPDADFSLWVQPQELGQVILFLSSDQASAVTGALVPVVGRV